ncbi:polysaccharide deacetylase family protein [Candidatus Methylacidithermus pantelleriae]|nr:polysaccharide deacetylase family protein [Candidatus Methylacidithermus pantelleriae]
MIERNECLGGCRSLWVGFARLVMTFRAPYLMPWLIRAKKRRFPEILWEGKTRQRLVALTFDDGPSRFTAALLKLLEAEGVRATFFVLGSRVSLYPKPVLEAHRKGHQIGLHGYWHRKFTRLSDSALCADLQMCQKVLTELLEPTGAVWYFRPPHGACDRRVVRLAQQQGLRVVLCSILPGQQLLPRGWKEEPWVVQRRVLRELCPGAIIALHDGESSGSRELVFDAASVVETTALLIQSIKALDYRFVTVEEMDAIT